MGHDLIFRGLRVKVIGRCHGLIGIRVTAPVGAGHKNLVCVRVCVGGVFRQSRDGVSPAHLQRATAARTGPARPPQAVHVTGRTAGRLWRHRDVIGFVIGLFRRRRDGDACLTAPTTLTLTLQPEYIHWPLIHFRCTEEVPACCILTVTTTRPPNTAYQSICSYKMTSQWLERLCWWFNAEGPYTLATRVHGRSSRLVNTGSVDWAPVNTGRQHE